MAKVVDSLREVHGFDLRCERLGLFIGDERVIPANSLEYKIRILFYIHFPLGSATHIVDLPGDEMIHDVCPGSAGILDEIDDPLVTLVDRVGLVEERVVDEFWDKTAVGVVVFMRAVAVHRPNTDRLGPEHLCRVHAHELARPLGDGVVIHLVGILDGIVHHHILRHNPVIIAIDLGAREEYHPELQFLLETEHMLGPDHVGLPEVLVVVFTVPATVFCGKVVDIIKLGALKDPLQLPVTPRICPDVVLPVVVQEVECNNLVTPAAQFVNKIGADESGATSDKNSLRFHAIFTRSMTIIPRR